MTAPPKAGLHVVRRVSNGAGYMINDNRANHTGVQECDIVCCSHCSRTIDLQKWRKHEDWETQGAHGGGGWCPKCMAPVCGLCAERMMTHGCEPAKMKIDAAVEATYRKQQNRRILGI